MSTLKKRYLFKHLQEDIQKKMVFISGPRQVGKTTMAQSLFRGKAGYLNWDVVAHREKILTNQLPDTPWWILDEIHKYKDWRGLVKGLFDQFKEEKQILVTGSAMLDYYRHGGDSLQGRYFFYRLHPLSVAELKIKDQKQLEELMTLGGFPEPYFSSSQVDAKRWSRDYRSRILEENLRDLEQVSDLGKLEKLYLRLPEIVGSTLSINSLREDLQVAHKTLSRWLDILSRVYAFFRISPLHKNILRAVKKEQKHYLFDWTLVKSPGARFENMVACHLLKWCHYQQDILGEEVNLHYFRDIDGREVDFILTRDQKVQTLIECKLGDAEVSKSLLYLKKKYPNADAYQISLKGQKEYVTKEAIHVSSSLKFLSTLV